MKVLGVYDRSGPKYHRIFMPLVLMGADHVIDSDINEENLKGVDVVFFNRAFHKQSINSVLKLKEKFGFKLVVDFDDHWRLGADHYLYSHYKENSISEIMEEYIKLSDAVFVTHERLYIEVKPINENCHILPNAIPEFGQFQFKKTEEEKTRLFWSGSVTHQKDVQILKEPVKRINKPWVKWVMGGYGKSPEWQAMASWFTNGGKFDHELIESLPVETYYGCYSKCDISLIPLCDTKFNSFKSNLKVLESANIGAPVIVSKVHPYLGLDHVDYVERQSDWYRYAKKLIDNPGMIKEKGLALKEYCQKNFNFNKINEQRKQILEYVAGK